MGTIEDAVAAQERNIRTRTGLSVDELVARVRACGHERHSDRVRWLKAELGMGYGDANLVAMRARELEQPTPPDDPADAWYAGRTALRPIHDAVLAAVTELGEFELAPKKAYASLRRRKQFAMVGPATRTEVEVGLNLAGVPATPRLRKTTGMCTHKVRLAAAGDVDAELVGWLLAAWQAAG